MSNQRNRKEAFFIFFFALASHWLMILLAYGAYRVQNPWADFTYLISRLTEAGDAPHYLYLAKQGYQSVGEKANLIVFFPLYPLLISLLSKLIFMGNEVLAGLFLSQVCFGISAVFLYRLLRLDCKEENARAGLFLFLYYPFMVFTMGIFSESLFLMLTVMGLFHIRQHNWKLVGIIGFFASLTRIQGILLLAPAFYEYIRLRADRGIPWKKYVKAADACLLGIPAGLLVYLVLNRVKQGEAFSFMKHQAAAPWYHSVQWVNQNLSKDYNMALEYVSLGYIIYWVQIILFFIAVLVLLYGVKKKVLTFYLVYGGIYTCFCYLAGWLISGGRYMIGCISLYYIFAAVENKAVRTVILSVTTALCAFYTLLYMQGQAIM